MFHKIVGKALKLMVAVLMMSSLLAFGCSIQEGQAIPTIASSIFVVVTMMIFIIVQFREQEGSR